MGVWLSEWVADSAVARSGSFILSVHCCGQQGAACVVLFIQTGPCGRRNVCEGPSNLLVQALRGSPRMGHVQA